jgi:hypothetical protein
MTRKTTSKEYALVLAEYMARFHDVPPSIVGEAAATELMRDALRRDEAIASRARPPAEGQG